MSENMLYYSINGNCFEKSSSPPPGNNVVIIDVMSLCNHLIMKTTLVGEGRGGKGTLKMQKVHINKKNVQ